eukprot:1160248-Pelagomonas_calceolata.AAC.3
MPITLPYTRTHCHKRQASARLPLCSSLISAAHPINANNTTLHQDSLPQMTSKCTAASAQLPELRSATDQRQKHQPTPALIATNDKHFCTVASAQLPDLRSAPDQRLNHQPTPVFIATNDKHLHGCLCAAA